MLEFHTGKIQYIATVSLALLLISPLGCDPDGASLKSANQENRESLKTTSETQGVSFTNEKQEHSEPVEQASESPQISLGSTEEENREYIEALKTLESTLERSQSSEIRDALSTLLSEGSDVAQALLRDENAQTLARTTTTYPYALLVDAGYHFPIKTVANYERLDQNEIPETFQKWFIPKMPDSKYPLGKGMLINIKGLSMWASVFKNAPANEIVLVLRGAELRPQFLKDFTKNAKTVAEHTLGMLPEHFMKSYELAMALKNKYPDKKLTITGSSLGGSLALFSGLSLGSKVYAFNSLGLNKKEIEFIQKQNASAFANADNNVTLVSVTGDMVSDSSDLLPKSFVNSYYGTVIKIPYFDDSWIGYYVSNHHSSEAIVKSLETFLKSRLSKYANLPPVPDYNLNFNEITRDLDKDEFLVINESGRRVRILAFSCSYSSGFGTSATYCDASMFRYPHRNFSTLESMSIYPAQSKIPGLSIAIPANPISRRLEIGAQATIRLPQTEKMSWPKDYFSKNYWTYITAMNESSDCKSGKDGEETYIGIPFYSGNWPSTWSGGKQLGWLRNNGENNPRVLVVSHFNQDLCSFEVRGF